MRPFPAAAVAALTLSLSACGGTAGDPGAGAGATAANATAAAEARRDAGHYAVRNLVSDGAVPAEHTDANLVNAWGLARLPASPWWVADNGTGLTTLYDGDGIAQPPASPLVVNVAGPGGQPAAPTGAVANPTTDFVVSSGGASGPARFLFASEDGTISGWNPGVPPPAPGSRSTTTIVAVDSSASGAVYKGLAVVTGSGGSRLYATDFHNGRVDVFDGSFAPVALPAGAFVDPRLPAGFAPFGIQEVNGRVVVTYAKQDAQAHDEVDGPHLGYVDAFTPDGVLVRRIAARGKLNAPWGVALAPPSGFGPASGRLLVGNFGDGHLVAYRLDDTRGDGDEGQYLTTRGGRITIDRLWGIAFGNGATAGPVNTLFFAAGPQDEAHGLFGRVDFMPATER